jgi:hypothetical protein
LNKKNTLFIFLVFIGIAFAFVSFMVFICDGKSKRWILYKMKIGGLLLTITAVSAGCRVRQGTCYKGTFRADHQDAVLGVSSGRSGTDLQNYYYSFNAGIGPEKHPPQSFGHEMGISISNMKFSNNINYTLGPYYNGFYRIGYLTDLFAESSYNLSLNKSKLGNNLILNLGISYPEIGFTPVGLSFFGNFTYSFGNENLSFYPSLRLYVSIPTKLKAKTHEKPKEKEKPGTVQPAK